MINYPILQRHLKDTSYLGRLDTYIIGGYRLLLFGANQTSDKINEIKEKREKGKQVTLRFLAVRN